MQARFQKKALFLLLVPVFLLPALPAQRRRKKADPFVLWLRERAAFTLSPLPSLGGKMEEDQVKKVLVPLVKKIATGSNRALAAEAILTFAAADPMGSLPRVMEGMTQARDPMTRQAAILAAGLGGEPGAAGPLTALISPMEKDGPEKDLALVSLALLRENQGKGNLLQVMQRMLSRSQQAHAQTILGILAALTLCGTPGDATPLVANLDQDKFADKSLRGAAAWTAARLSFPTVSKILQRLLKRSRDEARPFYLAALAYAPPKEKLGWRELYQAALRNRGRNARTAALALEALARRGGKEGIRYLSLLRKKAKGPWAHLVTVAQGMAKFREPAFLKEIQRDLTGSKDPERRAACALALGFLALPATGPALHGALKKETDPLVQGALALGLGLGKEKASAPDLAALFLRSQDPFTVQAAALALGAMEAAQDPPDLFWGERRKSDPLWTWRAQWLGWFSTERSWVAMEKFLERAPADPEAVTAFLRALRIPASRRKEAPSAVLCLAPDFPVPVRAFTLAREMLWGNPPKGK